jgi:hypothetical protein
MEEGGGVHEGKHNIVMGGGKAYLVRIRTYVMMLGAHSKC